MNARQKMTVVAIDALVLAELTFALYASALGPADDAPGIFLKLFLPIVAATLILGRLVVRKLGTPSNATGFPAEQSSGDGVQER